MKLDAMELCSGLASLENIDESANGYGKLVTAVVLYEVRDRESEEDWEIRCEWFNGKWVVTEIHQKPAASP